MRILPLLLSAVALTILPSSTQAQDASIKRIASVEGITEYQFDNGLKVLLFPDPSKQTITVNITYLVGSRHEGYGETGMAHLLEHLVFKGTPDHEDIPKELSDHGARPNGTTWFDRTNYFETFAATEENLRWALDLESDRMINSYIAKDDLDSEMTVVRNEYEAGENFPQSVLMKRVMSAAYSWHNYGKTTIGARSDIENVPIERLQAFYRKYYQPDNAVLLVAGKIDEEETLKLVHEYFGDIPRPTRELIPTYTAEPTQDGERLVTLKRTGDVQVVSCLYHTCSGLHKDNAALQVITQLMTTNPSGRLYQNLIETQKATQQYGYSFDLREPGFIYFGANVLADKSLEDAKNTLLSSLDSLAIHPPTEEEVERAKAEILNRIELGMTNTERIGLYMSEYIAMGDWRMMFIDRDRIEAVTTEDVVAAAKKYFKPSNRTVGLFIPEEEPDRVEIPEAPSVATLVTDYKGRELMAQGEAFDPSPSNIESRTLKGRLSNGMKYAFVPKQTKGDVVYANLGFRFGNEESLKGKRTLAAITPAMLDKGTAKMTRQEIKDQLDQWKAELNVYGGGGRSFLRIKTTKDKLAKVLDLAGEIMREPAFPENEFSALVQARIGQYEQFKSEPNFIAGIELDRHLNPYPKDHISYTETPEESVANLKDLTLDGVKEFYEEFYGAGESGTVTIIGEFDPDQIKETLESNFSNWKKPVDYQRVPSKVFAVEAIDKNIPTPDKANAMFIAGLDFEMNQDDAEYPALYVANYLLGGGFLNSRLAVRIRQEEGLSYYVGSNISVDAFEDAAAFRARAIYNPENREALEAAFFDVIQKVIDEGFTQEELDAAKKGIKQSNQVSRAQDESLLTLINNNQVFDRDMLWYEKYDQALQDLSLEDINGVFRKYIKPEKMSLVKAGDFKAKEIKP